MSKVANMFHRPSVLTETPGVYFTVHICLDWLTLIHSAEVENFSKRISIRHIFPFAHYPFNFSLLLSTFTQNNKNSVTLGSILRTNASGAEQMYETYNLNQIYPGLAEFGTTKNKTS